MPWKSLIGVGSQLGVGLVNNALSQRNADAQREWQENMWHLQNKYNDPSSMAMRMRAAGLNPFSMTDAQPAGSAGTGAMAETIPLADPLSAMRTIAEVENLNASTGRTESETEKILREISMLDVAFQRGLIEKDDYERKVKAYWEAYDEKSEYQLGREKTESEIAAKEAYTSLTNEQVYTEWYKQMQSLSQSNLNDALANDSNSLRQYRVDLLSAQTDDYRSQIDRRLAQTAIDYASLKVYQSVGKSQQLLNNALTGNERREFNEGIRTFNARKTAIEIGNEIGLTQKALNDYADKVNSAWQEVMLGNPFTSPKEFFNALGTVYGDTLRSITGNVSTFVPLDPSKVPTSRNKIGY